MDSRISEMTKQPLGLAVVLFCSFTLLLSAIWKHGFYLHFCHFLVVAAGQEEGQTQLVVMALHTPLPHNVRRGLTTFSGSLFINNKTRDCGVAQIYHPGHEVLSSLPLQMMLCFNVFYFPFWCLSEGLMLALKYSLLPCYYQFLLVAAFLILTLAEGLRLYLGYIGNLQEKVPELAGFLLLSFLIQLPLLLFLLTDKHIIQLPLEMAVHIVYLLFLASEITAAFFALKVMTKQLATQFYLKQFEDTDKP